MGVRAVEQATNQAKSCGILRSYLTHSTISGENTSFRPNGAILGHTAERVVNLTTVECSQIDDTRRPNVVSHINNTTIDHSRHPYSY